MFLKQKLEFNLQ